MKKRIVTTHGWRSKRRKEPANRILYRRGVLLLVVVDEDRVIENREWKKVCVRWAGYIRRGVKGSLTWSREKDTALV